MAFRPLRVRSGLRRVTQHAAQLAAAPATPLQSLAAAAFRSPLSLTITAATANSGFLSSAMAIGDTSNLAQFTPRLPSDRTGNELRPDREYGTGVNPFGNLLQLKDGYWKRPYSGREGKRATGWKSDQEIVCLTLLRLTDSGNDGNETNLSPLSPHLTSKLATFNSSRKENPYNELK